MQRTIYRPNDTLLIVDVQNAPASGAYKRDSVVSNIHKLVEKARLAPSEVELVVEKHYGGAFEETCSATPRSWCMSVCPESWRESNR